MDIVKNKIHTLVVSDLHLADAEPIHKKVPLWKKFRRKDYFIDQDFADFLGTLTKEVNGAPIELVLNGDIFDFDSITALPKYADYEIKNYEKKFGLAPTQEKSCYKMALIIKDHDVWFEALSNFIKEGNFLVFVIGNHDAELYWPQVQQMIIDRLSLSTELKHCIRFNEWFYVSQNDVLIEHGHQYDPYCMILNPIHPLIKKNGQYKIRLPFGNLANRYMVNVMGLKNPHSDDTFLKTVPEFIKFFYKYEMRVQPFMVLSWFFGAIRTLITSLNEGLYPSQKDPLTFDDRIKQIAVKSNVEPRVVLSLRENHAHPAVHRPMMVLRELWLDRSFLLIFIVWGCWQVFTTSYLFANVSLWWFLIPLFIMIPFFIYYSQGVKSDVKTNARNAFVHTPASAHTAGVKRVIHGHTHMAGHFMIQDVEYINTGTWSPHFKDCECLIPYGDRHFAWINGDKNRESGLYIWKNKKIELLSIKPHPEIPPEYNFSIEKEFAGQEQIPHI